MPEERPSSGVPRPRVKRRLRPRRPPPGESRSGGARRRSSRGRAAPTGPDCGVALDCRQPARAAPGDASPHRRLKRRTPAGKSRPRRPRTRGPGTPLYGRRTSRFRVRPVRLRCGSPGCWLQPVSGSPGIAPRRSRRALPEPGRLRPGLSIQRPCGLFRLAAHHTCFRLRLRRLVPVAARDDAAYRQGAVALIAARVRRAATRRPFPTRPA